MKKTKEKGALVVKKKQGKYLGLFSELRVEEKKHSKGGQSTSLWKGNNILAHYSANCKKVKTIRAWGW